MNDIPIYPDVKALEKCELHLHLDGSLRLETMLELAEQDRIEIPGNNTLAIKKKCVFEPGHKQSLTRFLDFFRFTLQFLQTEHALERTAFELLEDLAEENVKVAEIRFAPHLHTQHGLTTEQAVQAVLRGIQKGNEQLDIEAGVILCILRGLKLKMAHEVVDLVDEYKDKGVVAIDLAGDETKYPLEMYRNPLLIAKKKDLNITVHAGEAGPASEVKTAVLEIGAKRIGHGIAISNDEPLIQILNSKQVALEICPTSNVQTGLVKSFPFHPVNRIYQKGGLVTINSDNRLISDTCISKELSILIHYFHWEIEDIEKVQQNAFNASFLKK